MNLELTGERGRLRFYAVKLFRFNQALLARYRDGGKPYNRVKLRTKWLRSVTPARGKIADSGKVVVRIRCSASRILKWCRNLAGLTPTLLRNKWEK
jgi:hypothetical protein